MGNPLHLLDYLTVRDNAQTQTSQTVHKHTPVSQCSRHCRTLKKRSNTSSLPSISGRLRSTAAVQAQSGCCRKSVMVCSTVVSRTGR
jgi:hypothetical protein